MSLLISLWNGAIAFATLVWGLFLNWLFLFIAPVKLFDVLWILLPIWISWFFGEFFQEKRGTSFGNAISNGVVPLWVFFDWSRTLFAGLRTHVFAFEGMTILKVAICLLVGIYGAVIIIWGIKTSGFIHRFGRIREVTYVLVVLTPIMYDIVPLSWGYLVGIVVFFPLFYTVIEIICRLVPDPKAIVEDSKEATPRAQAQAYPQGTQPMRQSPPSGVQTMQSQAMRGQQSLNRR